jgi:predicted component of type VI protein secretion system
MWDPFQRELLAALGHTLLVPAAPGAPESAAAPAAEGDAALLQALARAAGIAPERLAGMPAIADLRRDPAAKRALWPRLRALRKATAP